MALIKCPECGGSVSDAANACIHCGFPIKDKKPKSEYGVCLIDGRRYNILEYVAKLRSAKWSGDNDGVENLIMQLADDTDLSISRATKLANTLIATARVPEIFDDSDPVKQVKRTDDTLRCPKCKSTNVVTGTRGYNLAWGFVGSNKTMNRCGKCGYKWEPKKR